MIKDLHCFSEVLVPVSSGSELGPGSGQGPCHTKLYGGAKGGKQYREIARRLLQQLDEGRNHRHVLYVHHPPRPAQTRGRPRPPARPHACTPTREMENVMRGKESALPGTGRARPGGAG